MRLLRFLHGAVPRWGVLGAEGIQPLGGHGDGEAEARALLLEGGAVQAAARNAPIPLQQAQLLPPLLSGATLYCIGLNYKSHVDETGRDLPPNPALFTRTPASVVGHGQALLAPRNSEQFDFEGEVAVVIGRGGRHVPTTAAMAHVAGYTAFNDGSVRDFQKHSVAAGKNFHRSGACGPWITTADELPDPSAIELCTRLNGEVVQSASTALLIYSIPTIVSYVSAFAELVPGDIIATGTPAGVGARRNPPLWMKAGDVIEVEVGGIGLLRNPVERDV